MLKLLHKGVEEKRVYYLPFREMAVGASQRQGYASVVSEPRRRKRFFVSRTSP